MKNLKDIIYFIIINIIMIFNVIPIIAAIIAAIIAGLIFSALYDNVFPAIIVICSGTAILTYLVLLPIKLIVYPAIYEYVDDSNIIFKLFDKYRTNKLLAYVTLIFFGLIDYIVYLYMPKVLIAYSSDDWIHFYKKSQLLGLTLCFLCLILWFKIRKPQNNGKMLFGYYLVLTTIISAFICIFKDCIIGKL